MRFTHILAAASLTGLALLGPTRAEAFCGFYVGGADTKLYNNATQVVLMREGTRTVLSMQNNYEGPPSGFAMVVPVPVILQKENVKTLPREVFAKVDQLDAPRLVEYWEQDPCRRDVEDDMERKTLGRAGPPAAAMAPAKEKADLGVTVEAQFSVGEYDIVILSAKDSGGLDTWLRQEKYAIPEGAAPFLKPYVAQGSKFFVAKVDPTKVRFENNMAQLSPLRFHYDSEQFTLPVRLGLMNAKGAQDLIVHILARGQRYEVTNYPNVAIPTNFDVKENVKGDFASFYTALFDETTKRHPGAVVTEYSWDASTCDPCPGPALYPQDFMTLGADVLHDAPPSQQPQATVLGPGGPVAPSRPGRRPFPNRFGGGFVITRLHARYTKESLGDDLHFRAAAPIVGGREFVQADGKPEQGAHAAGTNNFQGRYVIRHPWTGPIACKNPVRGVWGGPPGGMPDRPRPALNLAFAPRGKALASFVAAPPPGPNLLSAAGPTPASTMTLTDTDAGSTASDDAGASVPNDNLGGPPPAEPGARGCGSCTSAGGSNAGALAALGVVVASFLARRRRSR
jgi:MYXO-CTERM domain-containing protein